MHARACAAATQYQVPLWLPAQPQPRRGRFDEQRYKKLHEQLAKEAAAPSLGPSPALLSLHHLALIRPVLQGGGVLSSQRVAVLLRSLREAGEWGEQRGPQGAVIDPHRG